jgi:Antitoxin MazE-like
MAQSDEKKRATREKVRAYRERMRKRGLRPIQIWVPDVRAEGFRAEAHRQSSAVAMSPKEAGDQAWIDSVSDWGDE